MPRLRGAILSWPVALVLVLSTHLVAAWWLIVPQKPPLPIPQPLPAIMLDLAPAPAPPAPAQPPAPPVPEYRPMPHPPVPQIETLPPAISEAALPPSVKQLPRRQAPKPKPVKPKKVETAMPTPPVPPQAASAVKAATQPAATDPQQQAAQQQKEAALAAASLAAKSDWLGEVVQHIAKFKRTPRGRLRVPLRAVIAFAIDREGRLLSPRLLQSSGRDEIDEEALAWIRRADPLPKPPADLSAADLSQGFTIPVDFMLR